MTTVNVTVMMVIITVIVVIIVGNCSDGNCQPYISASAARSLAPLPLAALRSASASLASSILCENSYACWDSSCHTTDGYITLVSAAAMVRSVRNQKTRPKSDPIFFLIMRPNLPSNSLYCTIRYPTYQQNADTNSILVTFCELSDLFWQHIRPRLRFKMPKRSDIGPRSDQSDLCGCTAWYLGTIL